VQGMVGSMMPHERMEQNLAKENVGRGMRFEIVVTIDLEEMKSEYRTGR
jgi:hypothetical protein